MPPVRPESSGSPIENLADAVERAATSADRVGEHAQNLVERMDEERQWRVWTRRALRLGAGMLLVFVPFAAWIAWSVHQQQGEIRSLQIGVGISCAHAQTLGCENHQILAALPSLITSTDCTVRQDLADVLKVLLQPRHVTLTLPGNKHCPPITF